MPVHAPPHYPAPPTRVSRRAHAATADGAPPALDALHAIAFTTVADTLDKLGGGGRTRTAVARYEGATVVQASLHPLVLTLLLSPGAPVDAALALLPPLEAALEPVRAAAAEYMGL